MSDKVHMETSTSPKKPWWWGLTILINKKPHRGRNTTRMNVKCFGLEQAHLRETLKPKTLSYSFMSFFSRVLFPAPDGPLNTTGLGPAIAKGEAERKGEFSVGNHWVRLGERWHTPTGYSWYESPWDHICLCTHFKKRWIHDVTAGQHV